MNAQPYKSEVPINSKAQASLKGAFFYDAWAIDVSDSGGWAMDYFVAAVKQTPKWIDVCMDIRNRVVQLFGLKDLKALSAVLDKAGSDYLTGDRVGIFTVFGNSPSEACIGDKDKHLDVVLYIHQEPSGAKDQVRITVTTVVHVKNLLGRLYMIPVTPMHKIIAPALMKKMANAALPVDLKNTQ